jgi:glycopeptide antibiotics resistance protein
MVMSVTLFPIVIGNRMTNEFLFHSINLIPLTSIFSEISQIGTAYGGDSIFMIKLIVRNVGGNILLLMPLGFLVPILWRKYRSLKGILLLGLLVSVSIECLQLVELVLGISFGRRVDIDDVICNVFGTFIGYVLNMGLSVFLRNNNRNDYSKGD